MPRKGTNKKHNAKTKKKNKGAVITVDYEEYDYGDIEEGGDGKTRPGGCSCRAAGLDLQSRPIEYKDFQSAKAMN